MRAAATTFAQVDPERPRAGDPHSEMRWISPAGAAEHAWSDVPKLLERTDVAVAPRRWAA
jgi:hypothetical protein